MKRHQLHASLKYGHVPVKLTLPSFGWKSNVSRLPNWPAPFATTKPRQAGKTTWWSASVWEDKTWWQHVPKTNLPRTVLHGVNKTCFGTHGAQYFSCLRIIGYCFSYEKLRGCLLEASWLKAIQHICKHEDTLWTQTWEWPASNPNEHLAAVSWTRNPRGNKQTTESNGISWLFQTPFYLHIYLTKWLKSSIGNQTWSMTAAFLFILHPLIEKRFLRRVCLKKVSNIHHQPIFCLTFQVAGQVMFGPSHRRELLHVACLISWYCFCWTLSLTRNTSSYFNLLDPWILASLGYPVNKATINN